MNAHPKTRAVRDVDVLYAIGPGDAVRAFSVWLKNEEDVTQPPRTFSGQFFDLCRELDLRASVISSHGRPARECAGNVCVENVPKAGGRAAGLRYHAREVLYGIRLARRALRSRARVLIVDSGTTHWFVLAPLPLLGVRVIASLHNGLHPYGEKPRWGMRRVVHALDGLFWNRAVDSAVCVSEAVARQVRERSAKLADRIFIHRPMYRRQPFMQATGARPADHFAVVFSGRVEPEKGILEVLDAADHVQRQAPGAVRWHICGEGSALPECKRRVDELGLQDLVRFHGRLDQREMIQAFRSAHVTVVPSRNWGEAFAMVAAESVLAGTPVICSPYVPAAEVLGRAALVVPDAGAIADTILKLQTDATAYGALCAACTEVQEQFYDERNSLTAALRRALSVTRARRGRHVSGLRDAERTPTPEGAA